MAAIQNIEMKNTRTKVLYGAIVAFLVVGGIVQILPMFLMITGAFKTDTQLSQIPPVFWPTGWDFGAIFEVLDAYHMGRNFLNTFYICAGVILIQVPTSAMAAFSLSKLKPKGGKIVFLYFIATMMFSAQAQIFPLYIMLASLNVLNFKTTYVLVCSIGITNIVLFKGFFDNIPKSLEEAAKVDGASSMKIFTSIVLPLSKPVFMVVILNVFMATYNDFFTSLMLLPDEVNWTVMIRLYSAQSMGGISLHALYSLLTVATVPILLVYVFAQKYLIEGISLTGIKG